MILRPRASIFVIWIISNFIILTLIPWLYLKFSFTILKNIFHKYTRYYRGPGWKTNSKWKYIFLHCSQKVFCTDCVVKNEIKKKMQFIRTGVKVIRVPRKNGESLPELLAVVWLSRYPHNQVVMGLCYRRSSFPVLLKVQHVC